MFGSNFVADVLPIYNQIAMTVSALNALQYTMNKYV